MKRSRVGSLFSLLFTFSPSFSWPFPSQNLVESFESLSLGGPSGNQQDAVDIGQLPRPAGPLAAQALQAQPPCDPGNCSPDCMRLTVNGIPSSTALRSRCEHGIYELEAIEHPSRTILPGGHCPLELSSTRWQTRHTGVPYRLLTSGQLGSSAAASAGLTSTPLCSGRIVGGGEDVNG